MKILYVLSYISQNGGVQTVVNNYYSMINKKYNKEIKVDFLTLLPNDKDMEQDLINKGSNVYHIEGSKQKDLRLFLKEINKFFKQYHDYDIIHCHQSNLDNFYLRKAKQYKIPVRIMHSHSTNYNINGVRMKLLKVLCKHYANYYFACSKEAGEFYFGKKAINSDKFFVINNAIDLNKYAFDKEKRESIRKELELKDELVIGTVSRLSEEKNIDFLIDVFNELLQKRSNSKLLIIGDGPLKNELIKKVSSLKISDKVIFYGFTDNVQDALQCMDMFILASKFEGVPLTVIEAAANGLKYVISDSIDSHLAYNDLEKKISLEKTADEWVDEILDFSLDINRKKEKDWIVQSGFSIDEQTDRLKEIYYSLLEREKSNEKIGKNN